MEWNRVSLLLCEPKHSGSPNHAQLVQLESHCKSEHPKFLSLRITVGIRTIPCGWEVGAGTVQSAKRSCLCVLYKVNNCLINIIKIYPVAFTGLNSIRYCERLNILQLTCAKTSSTNYFRIPQ